MFAQYHEYMKEYSFIEAHVESSSICTNRICNFIMRPLLMILRFWALKIELEDLGI